MDWTLDIGCGNNPCPAANVFVDKYPKGNAERSGPIRKIPKNFIVADVEDLPFKDKVFKFCFCIEVLEHTERPERALYEMQRVSKKGFIETPHIFNELTIGKPFHRWMLLEKGNWLFLFQKLERENLPFRRKLFESVYGQIEIRDLSKKAKLLFCKHKWKNQINYIVVYNNGKIYIRGGKADVK